MLSGAHAAQREYFASGATLPVDARTGVLRRLRECFVRREEDVYAALSADLGKPRFEVLAGEVAGVLEELDAAIRGVRGWARDRRRRTPMVLFPGRAFVRPQPYGCVLILSPWNFPVDLALSPLIGAVAAGNVVTLKPSEHTPASARLLAELVAESFPAGHVTVHNGGPEVAQALLELPHDYIFFTGGEAVGRLVMRAAAERLTPVTLELGGKSPVVVTARADLDLAARRILHGRGFNAGQVCIGPDYILVERSVRDPFLERIRHWHPRLYPTFPAPDVARIVHRRHFDRLIGLLGEGTIVCGGRYDPATLAIEPTVLTGVPPGARILDEEVFGPIVPVLEVDGLEAAIRHVNERPRPLAAYLFSRDGAEQERFLRGTTSGGVTLNDTLSQFVNRRLPFGGVGPSGMGRYHREASFETFSHFRSVQVAGTFPDLPLRYPPYTERAFRLFRRLVRGLR